MAYDTTLLTDRLYTRLVLALMLHDATKCKRYKLVRVRGPVRPMAYDTRLLGDIVPGAANDTSQGCPEAVLPII